MKPEKILPIAAIILAAVLALKYIKQLIFLSFTLFSFKAVWLAFIILFVFASFKKNRAFGWTKKTDLKRRG